MPKKLTMMLSEELFWKLKALAVSKKQTVTKVVTDAIQKMVDGEKK